jgi:GT2 family glycosyltransferase
VTLSVVIPTYGRVAPLARLLASIAAQTVAPDEVIVVDQNAPGFLDEIIAGDVIHLRLAEPIRVLSSYGAPLRPKERT